MRLQIALMIASALAGLVYAAATERFVLVALCGLVGVQP